MTVLLAVLATLAIGISCKRFGWNSLVSFGLIGTYIYSIPGFLGLTNPVHLGLKERNVFFDLSSDTVWGLCLVWATLLIMATVTLVPSRPEARSDTTVDTAWVKYLPAFVGLALIGSLIIAITLGPTYFLQARSEINTGSVSYTHLTLPTKRIV